MSSDSTPDLGFNVLDRDAHPDGSIDVVGAIYNIETASTAAAPTRGEISNVLNHPERDYQWIRYRCDSLSEAGVLEINHVQVDERVEKRYSVADDYRDDARSIARALTLTGGEIPQKIGVDEFVDVAGSLGDALEQIDDHEDQIDELAARVEGLAELVDDGASTGGELTDGSSAAGDGDPHEGDPYEGVGLTKEEQRREDDHQRKRDGGIDDSPWN